MNNKQLFYARKIFELRVHQAKGEAYQSLFNNVMQLRWPTFVPMRPYGNVGDRKNDGYIPAIGKFFQVYAPVNPADSLAAAAAKATKDFGKLFAFWNSRYPVLDYRFAFNDAYSGSVVPVEEAMAQIANTHAIQTGPFLVKDLEAAAFELAPDQLERALDVLVPEPGEIRDADFGAVRDVVEHIMHADAPNPPTGKLLAPEFATKIAFNNLSQSVGELLSVAARQSDVVGNFFSNRPGTHRQALRDHLAQLYAAISDNAKKTKASSDVVFFELLEAMQPKSRKHERQIQNAAQIVMAFYFEACDIFEPPNASP